MVQIRNARTKAVISTSSTDNLGRYELKMPRSGHTTDPYVAVIRSKTEATGGLRDIEVMDHPKFHNIYEVVSPPLVADIDQVEIIHNFDITEELGAGAFNILDTLIQGYDLVWRMSGQPMGELNAFWNVGADVTDTSYCSRALYDDGKCPELRAISIQGYEENRDEYDDMVILKEFFRFALDRASRESHPGGTVTTKRDDPTRAWVEGVSRFFACDVNNSRFFIDSRPNGVYEVTNVELADNPFYYNMTNDGNLSPYLVAALMWDIRDSTSGEDFDHIDRMRLAIYDTLFRYIGGSYFTDRGATGVDMVDFFDGWMCRDWQVQSGLEDLFTNRGYSYDFSGPSSCQ